MNRKTILSALSVLAVFGIVGIAYAIQAPYNLPIGTPQRCICTGTVFINQQGPFAAGGNISARTTNNSSSNAIRPWTELQVFEFNNTQNDPRLGTLVWTADASRPVVTRIESNIDGRAFPATSIFRFHANVAIGNNRYRTVNPIELQATVNEWPARNAQYTQIGETKIENIENPSNIVTISGINVTVNPG